MITYKALDMLELESPLIRNMNRQYDDSFAAEGGKIGSTARIRLPERVLVKKGAALQVDDSIETSNTISITDQAQCSLNFTSAELKLNIDDFAERKLKPRISQIAATIEAEIAAQAYKDFYMSVGTPGTTPATALVLLEAMQKLDEGNVGRDGRVAVINPAANAALVDGLKGFYNPSGAISKQFKTGMISEGILGFSEIAMGQGISSHTCGTLLRTLNATTVSATLATQGATSMVFSQGSVTTTLKAGDVFTVAAVYAVNPQTRVSTGSLQQFVVTADATFSSGTATVDFFPPIYTKEQALATVDSFPQSSAVITVMGAVSGVYPQNLIFHKDAIVLATVDLPLPQGVHMASRQSHAGISMRIIKDYDINTDRFPCRIDILYGIKTIRKEYGVRLWG
jgi:hypothetical protein